MIKNIAVIGAGISGLSAGIHALQSGYSVTIYEKNKLPGGECTGWDRQGYHIDNCIHFLIGCKENDRMYEMWKNLNVLTDELKLYREPYFYCMEDGDVKLHLWRNLERTRNEFLELAPEDSKELNQFFDCVKGTECVKPPCDISPAHMNPIQFMKFGKSMMGAGKANKEYGNQTIHEFAARFKNPYVRAMFGNYFNENFVALDFVVSYAFYTSDTAAIPLGGSNGIIRRMCEKFEALGGNIIYDANLNGVEIKDGMVNAMITDNGMRIEAESFIWCADPYRLFFEITGVEHLDKNLKYMYENPEGYLSNTGYQAAFGITSNENLSLPEGSVIFPCESFEIAGKSHNFCGMRVYDYDDYLFPSDKRVIQCNILQNAYDYNYWSELYRNKEKYNEEKNTIAEELKIRIETQYPQLRGKLMLLGTYSPITFTKWCNAYKGGYMSFNRLKGYKAKFVKSTIKGLKNLFLAGQWIQNGGGLPVAAASGKFAVQMMDKELR